MLQIYTNRQYVEETERGMQKMQFHILSNRAVSVVFLSKIKDKTVFNLKNSGKIAPGPRLNSANHLLVKVLSTLFG